VAGAVFLGAPDRGAGIRFVRSQDTPLAGPNLRAGAGRWPELRHSQHCHLIIGAFHTDDGDQRAFFIQIIE